MKYCEEYAALLDAFAEGDLFTEDMIQVQKHLNECPACQAYVDDLLAIRAAFPRMEDTEVPSDFTAKVMAAVAATPQAKIPVQAERPAKKKYPWRKTLLPLAACFAIVVLVQGLPTAGNKSAESVSTAAMTTESAIAYSITAGESEKAAPQAAEPRMEAIMDAATEDAAPAPKESAAGTISSTENERFSPAESIEYAEKVDGSILADNAPAEEPQMAITAFAEVTLSSAEVGTLLDAFTPTAETESRLEYQLSADAFESFLAALSDKGIVPEGEIHPAEASDAVALVIVEK